MLSNAQHYKQLGLLLNVYRHASVTNNLPQFVSETLNHKFMSDNKPNIHKDKALKSTGMYRYDS